MPEPTQSSSTTQGGGTTAPQTPSTPAPGSFFSDFRGTAIREERDSGRDEGDEGVTTGDGTPADGNQSAAAGDAPTNDESLLTSLAEEYGLDLGTHRKALEQILKGKGGAQPGQQKPNDADKTDAFDPAAFERELLGEGQPQSTEKPADVKPAEAKPADGTQPQQAPPKYGDIGDAWKGPEDAWKAEEEAYAAGDYKKLSEVKAAIFKRQAAPLLNMIGELVEQRLKDFAEKDLAEDLAPIRQQRQMERESEMLAEARSKVIGGLKNLPQFKDIDAMFKAEDGKTITFNGQQFPDTPFNRLIAAHPEILNIDGDHEDPAKRRMQAFSRRYIFAHRLWRNQQKAATAIPAEMAPALVEAGRGLADKDRTDLARSGVNAGAAAGTGTGGKDSYVANITRKAGGARSFGDML
jgi:hypothetical protein